ncbi:GyrI-like domain-containing protein [uncultured Sphaerochaeta sp.]|uniref:GyrI-like domain-containing protein n=1 Tax=uncultured Sphaerochaeta sp. TaxID=886478 RepID=UPI002AA76BC5|nr:GyrI-like domain-containing protein [uncultured Sphaerochaeta sp.]
MAYDFKKEYRKFYLPKQQPSLITIPNLQFIAAEGDGDPNEEGGLYQQVVQQLYTVAYTLKMSYRSKYKIEGFFEYVVPPLEGLWFQKGPYQGFDITRKDLLTFISMIRIPDFIQEEDVEWAKEEAFRKKGIDCSRVQYRTYTEGLCVQALHIGSYDSEQTTIESMHAYALQEGYIPDVSPTRLHHEIYLSDPRRSSVDTLKTVVRHPVRKA